MMHYIYYFLKSLLYFFVVKRNLKRQKHFMSRHLAPVLNSMGELNDGSIDEEDIQKINLYGQAIPAVLGEAYCSLRGRGMSHNERLSITFLGSITGLFDDLFDRRNLSAEYILNLLQHPVEKMNARQNENLLVRLYLLGLRNSDHPEVIKEYAIRVYEAQISSLRQETDELTEDELKLITYNKGGFSMPLYRCALKGDLSPVDYDLLYNLGAIGQLENDIFDIYKDYKAGLRTLPTTINDITHLRKIYENQIDKIFDLINQTAYPEKNKKKFRHFSSMVVCSGLVCLDMFQDLANQSENGFQLQKYNRKQLICDMQRLSNLLKMLHYTSKFAKK